MFGADRGVRLGYMRLGTVRLPCRVEAVLDVDAHAAQLVDDGDAFVLRQRRPVRVGDVENVDVAADVLELAVGRSLGRRGPRIGDLEHAVLDADQPLAGKLVVLGLVVVELLLALAGALLDGGARLDAHGLENLATGQLRLEEADFALLAGRAPDEHVDAVQRLGLDHLRLRQAGRLRGAAALGCDLRHHRQRGHVASGGL